MYIPLVFKTAYLQLLKPLFIGSELRDCRHQKLPSPNADGRVEIPKSRLPVILL